MSHDALSEDVRALREIAHAFARDVLRPAGLQADRSGRTPWDAVRTAGDLGLVAANVPEEYGGPGVGMQALAAVMEELGWGNFGLAAKIGAAALVAQAILEHGSAEQKRRYLGRLCSTDRPWVGALALTEPESGSELEIDLGGPPQHLQTRAERQGDGYRITGQKRFITNGGEADLTLLLARVGDGGPQEGWTLFLVERGAGGFTAGRQIPTLGLRGSYTGEIHLDGCKVPETARLGGQGEGLAIVLRVLEVARTMIASAAVGLARGACEAATAYARERRQFGVPLLEHQLVAGRLAGMRLRIDAARALVHRAALDLAAGRSAALSAAEAKLFASEMAVHVTQDALHVHGGYGYTQDLPLEMWVRDAVVSRIFFGTSEMQALEIAHHLAAGA